MRVRETFTFVLALVDVQGLLKGQTLVVDATLLETNAALKSIVCIVNGNDWKANLIRLMREEGKLSDDEEPTDENLRRFILNGIACTAKREVPDEGVQVTPPDLARFEPASVEYAPRKRKW